METFLISLGQDKHFKHVGVEWELKKNKDQIKNIWNLLILIKKSAIDEDHWNQSTADVAHIRCRLRENLTNFLLAYTILRKRCFHAVELKKKNIFEFVVKGKQWKWFYHFNHMEVKAGNIFTEFLAIICRNDF